ncbi:MAG: SRPBCC domain-containing protein [Acidobacteria bacterium]|nr:SRPBCC domain-containing protein [Acidobacteriota bacterium]
MHIPVPLEEVFAALDSGEGRSSFWAESAVEVDGKIEFQFINGYGCTSTILERQPPRVLSIDYIGGPARFELTADGRGGTDLLLTHEGVRPEEWNEVHAGWLNVLFPLKAWVTHGVDLRNHDPKRSWDQGYADQ